jgi:threonine dehydrogenase-like Zn-dependent dehydrogenase
MKAVVYHGVGDIRLEDVPEPAIQDPTDAIVRLTATAICGTDLHMIRGTMPGMAEGTVLGHEGVGVVEEVGADVRNLRPGDRVVVPSTIACGVCSYCRKGYYAQCDNANPQGHRAGTAFFGGPESSGPFAGLQAERARIPFAHVGLVKLPDAVSDEQALLVSDIFPTGWFGAELAHPHPGSTVAVFGCGPVGQFVIASLKIMNVGRIFAVDHVPSRLEMARDQGAEVIDYEREDPVEAIVRLTSGIGVDRAIDAVGVDAEHAHHGPGAPGDDRVRTMDAEVREVTLGQARTEGHFRAGDAPSQALEWAVDALAKAGTMSIIGVYPPTDRFFPIGQAMNKNLTLRMGNCNHRKYVPMLVELIRTGVVDPARILTQDQPLLDAVEAYERFDERADGWLKVALHP